MRLRWFPLFRRLALLAMLPATLCPVGHRAAAQTSNNIPAQIQTDQTQNQAQTINAAAQTCTQSADFCTSPTFDTVDDPIAVARGCAAVNVPQKLNLVTFCFDPNTGLAIPGAIVQSITAQADPASGFHLHGASSGNVRPAGQANPSSGPVGADNTLHFTYTAADLSGLVTLTSQLTLSDGTPCVPAVATIATEIPGLGAIPASGTGYNTTTSTGHDGNNLSANPSTATNLQQMPILFDDVALEMEQELLIPADPIPTLTYTSIALPFGGLFDVDVEDDPLAAHEWHSPHCGHRRGVEADLRIKNVPMEFRGALIWSIIVQGFTMPVRHENPSFPTASHWHLKSH